LNTHCKNCGEKLEEDRIGRDLCGGCIYDVLVSMVVSDKETRKKARLSLLYKEQQKNLGKYINSWDAEDE
jgi:hypothetical protein